MTSNDGNASIYEISLPSGARCEIELNEDRQIDRYCQRRKIATGLWTVDSMDLRIVYKTAE